MERTLALRRKNGDADQQRVKPQGERHISHGPDDNRKRVIAKTRRWGRGRAMRRTFIPALGADARENGPDEDGAEQKDRTKIAVRQQVRQGPDLYAGQHRMLETGLDPSWQVGGRDADKGEPDQQESEVARPGRRIPHGDVARRAISPETD